MAEDRDIASWLKRQLARREWTAADLSRRIEMSPGRISEWVNGKRTPSSQSCLRLADAFDADPDYVLALAGHRAPSKPLPPDEVKQRIHVLIDRAPMTPAQADGLEAMLSAWIKDASDKDSES